MFYLVLLFGSDFLKLRNFYYYLELLNGRPQNRNNKNVKGKSLVPSGKCFPQRGACSTLRAKIVIPPQVAAFKKFVSLLPVDRKDDTM